MPTPPTSTRNTLTPRQAVAFGLLTIAMGFTPLLSRFVPARPHRPDDAPPWVVLLVGAVFVLCGLALIVGYGIARDIGPTGELEPNAPRPIRAVQRLLGFSTVACMCAIMAWVGFGKGERHFSTTRSLPFVSWHSHGGELSGRIVFGSVAVLMAAALAAVLIVAARRLLTGAPTD
ncbi:MAG TPA: hypothetical protein VII52_02155 [Gemmatimonadaceae bacterium]